MKVIQTEKERISRRAGQKAINLAKERNDVLYKAYKKYRTLYMIYKNKIINKYKSRAIADVRRNYNK